MFRPENTHISNITHTERVVFRNIYVYALKNNEKLCHEFEREL